MKRKPPTRVPMFDHEAERIVLSECIVRPVEVLPTVDLEADDFERGEHRAVWAALQRLRERQQPIDLVMVSRELQLAGKLHTPTMAEIGAAPAARGEHLRAHVATVRTKTRLRRQQLRAEELSRASGEGVVLDEPADSDPSPFDDAWGPVGLDVLERTPLARRWLLRRPNADGTAGAGLLPLGKCGLFVADGGVGKSTAMIALAVSVIVGRQWFGHFHVGTEAVGRRVLLALGEEDQDDRDRRIYDTCCSLRLNDIERALVAKNLVAMPLAGKPVALVAPGPDRRVRETAALEGLRRRLRDDAGDGWALVVLDPLARFAEGEVEVSNAEATRFVQAVETLTEVPGRPTVLLAHHASADGVKAGNPSSRGVTALRNGFRWEAVLRVDDEGDVMFRQAKSNYSAPMPVDVRLVRGEGGVLRAATPSLLQEREGAALNRKTEALERDVARLLGAIGAHGGSVPTKSLAIQWAGMGSGPGRLAFDESVTKGHLVNSGSSKHPMWTLKGGVEKLPIPHSPGVREETGHPAHGLADSVREESARVRESATLGAA